MIRTYQIEISVSTQTNNYTIFFTRTINFNCFIALSPICNANNSFPYLLIFLDFLCSSYRSIPVLNPNYLYFMDYNISPSHFIVNIKVPIRFYIWNFILKFLLYIRLNSKYIDFLGFSLYSNI